MAGRENEPLTGYDPLDCFHEECGVFGVFGSDEASVLTALGLHALQHRGQEAAGIVSYDGNAFHAHRALGHVGDNFGAGMTGGMAYVYDSEDSFVDHVNDDTIIYQRIQTPYWENVLKRAVEEHQRETQSEFAERMLNHWNTEREKFWQVIPTEMIYRYEQPVTADENDELRA